jgi:(p)ppGpp synthase/HD superfamily hydrolase
MFSSSVERALRLCAQAHAGQTRKGAGSAPYALHPVHMALILARLGERDEVLIAALLHDVVEDCPGWTLERIEQEFDASVAAVVAELTEDKRQSWDQRKAQQVAQVPELSPSALKIKAADKLHNLATLADDLEQAQDQHSVWLHFHGGRERTLRMSRLLVEALAQRLEEPLRAALFAALLRVERAAQRS